MVWGLRAADNGSQGYKNGQDTKEGEKREKHKCGWQRLDTALQRSVRRFDLAPMLQPDGEQGVDKHKDGD
jgi:hypothetical protein